MALNIEVSEVGDVTILRLEGRIVLGLESASLRRAVEKLIAQQKRKIILNVDNVAYIDSSGNGTVVAAHHTALASGALLKFCHLHGKLRDVWQVSKLLAIFDVYPTEVDALRSFASPGRICVCPACGQRCGPSLLSGALWATQQCSNPSCGARLLIQTSRKPENSAEIARLEFQTYEKESFVIEAGIPFKCQIAGRLDLFSSSALEKCWLALPMPRRVVFDLSAATEISDVGRNALVAILARMELDSRATASLEGLNAEQISSFPPGAPFYRLMADALRALGDIVDTPHWVVRIREE
jgi:anti-sigma B factor antagonist